MLPIHFILYVKDQEASTAFYRKLLRKEPVLHVPGMTEFELAEGCKLGLMPNAGIARIISGEEAHAETRGREEGVVLPHAKTRSREEEGGLPHAKTRSREEEGGLPHADTRGREEGGGRSHAKARSREEGVVLPHAEARGRDEENAALRGLQGTEEKLPHPELGSGIPRCELYLHVEDVDLVQEHAVACGARLVSAAEDRDWGDRVCYLADADGHVLAFAASISR